MGIFKNIEECAVEVNKRSAQIDIEYHSDLSLYNTIARFVIYLNVCIIIVLTFITCGYHLLPTIPTMIIDVIFMISQAMLSSFCRYSLNRNRLDAKLMIIQEVLNHFEHINELDKWEIDKYINEYLLPAANLKTVDE